MKAGFVPARPPSASTIASVVLQTKPRVHSAMNSLKKRLIRNGLPADELYEMGEKFKAEIRAIAEGIMERCRR